MKHLIFLCLLFCLPFLGCDLESREKALQEKEARLNQKEKDLLLKEELLQHRQQELQALAQKLDTARRDSTKDSTFIVDPRLLGTWSVVMTCTETTCPGSAVGDTKNEQWQITSDSTHIIARAMEANSKAVDGNNVSRVYRGVYTGNTLELVEDREGSPAQPATRMVVRLTLIDPTTMEGQREIIREGDCRIRYALKMNKQ